MKKEKGISMISLTVSIIIIIIIAGIAVMSGSRTDIEAKVTELYHEMKSVKESVSYIQMKLENLDSYTLQNGINCGFKINTESLSAEEKGEIGIVDDGEYYYLYGATDRIDLGNSTEVEQIEEKMDIGPLKRTYVVNYDTGYVGLKEISTIGSHTIRTYEQLDYIVKNEDISN